MNVALFGTGLMGGPMAEALAADGHTVTVYNRTRRKAEALNIGTGRVAIDPNDALRSSDCVVLMLSDVTAIRETLLTASAATELTGKTVIQMGTIGASESVSLQMAITGKGGTYLEAPVLGSIPEARSSKLIVMVGAEKNQFERWVGLLRSFGPSPLLIGPVGHAAAVKLAMNELIATLTAAFSLSIGLVERLGVSVDRFMTVLRDSALYAPTFDKKLSRIVGRDYTNPNFPLKHLQKDLTLFIAESSHRGLSVEMLLELNHALVAAAESHGEMDYTALNEVMNPAP